MHDVTKSGMRKRSIKVKDKPVGCNVTEYERFIDRFQIPHG